MPLENCPTGFVPTSCRSTCSSAVSGSVDRGPRRCPACGRGNRHELGGGEVVEDASCCGTSPIDPADVTVAGAGPRRGRGGCPRDAGVRPHSIRNSVDLPAPFGPRSAVTPRSMREADLAHGHHRSVELGHVVDGDHPCERWRRCERATGRQGWRRRGDRAQRRWWRLHADRRSRRRPGCRRRGLERLGSGRWSLLTYGGVVAHRATTNRE